MSKPENAPNLYNTLVAKNKHDSHLVNDGDCGIIVSPDGNFRLFSTGISPDLADPSKWGDKELAQIEVARKILAISMALHSPEIMNSLYAMVDGVLAGEQQSNDPRH